MQQVLRALPAETKVDGLPRAVSELWRFVVEGPVYKETTREVVRSTILQVPRGRQIGSGGVPPPCVPETPLTHDISGSRS